MKQPTNIKGIKAKKKIIPSLGGIKKNYIRKDNCLKSILIFLSDKLSDVEHFGELNINQKNHIRKIQEDIKRISSFKNKKVMDFYFEVHEIIAKY